MLFPASAPGKHLTKTLTSQNTAYELLIPEGTVQLLFQLEGLPGYRLQYSYDGTHYMTAGSGVSPDRMFILAGDAFTLYLKCPDAAGQVVKVEYWQG